MSAFLTMKNLSEYEGKTKDLTADELARLKKELSEDLFATKTLLDFISGGEVNQQLAFSILGVKESRLGDLTSLTGIELDSPLARNERYAALRQANERIRELETQMGSAVSAEHVGKALDVLSRKLEHWWDVEGFGHISETSFTKYGNLEVKFSCNLFGDFGLRERKRPVSEKEAKKAWIESIAARGFDLVRESDGSTPDLLDSENNRRLLAEMLSKHFPSATLTKSTNHFNSRTNKMELNTVTVFFRNLSEIEALPLPAKEE